MKIKKTQYLVGIDLGTTHTVVAYAPIETKQEPHIFPIKQLVNFGQVATRNLLPSVRYHPAESELSENDKQFIATGDYAILGEAARVLGAKSKGRFVTSAKSWLSHPSVDHSAEILPWGASEDVRKVSPLDASASYLFHIRSAWLHAFPNAPLEQQDIVITVPASFDEGARSLTLEAAKIAGLPKVRLLEEPQAVCYDWLRRHANDLKETLKNVHLLLICDVGGGTTDFTLIKIEQHETEPKLARIGVGDHLMLGGDNIDLALAHLAEKQLTNGEKRLSTAELSQLLEQCRIVKEKLLAKDAPEFLNVTLLSGGAKLLGGTRSVKLTREEVRTIALDGFFPLSKIDELPDKKRSGVVEFGLPYAAEPAVSKHIAAFLKLHSTVAQNALNQQNHYVPDALLLNGGVFRSEPITQRAIDLLNSWSDKQPVLLDNPHPELAVAFGAVSYAIARREKKLKIGGGSARSYFLLLDNEENEQKQGICILPRGSEEGDEIILKNHRFALRLGTPVRFHLASTTGDKTFKSGDLVEINDDFHSLPPLAVAFTSEFSSEVIVELAVMQTEVGTLQIECVSIDNAKQRWNVEFQIRRQTVQKNTEKNGLPANFVQVSEKISGVFGAKSKQIDPKAVKNLRTDLEKMLGDRSEWSIPLLREMFTLLLEGEKYRKRSENHERVWSSLVGYCLRPGFGYPLDDWRVEQIWKLYPQSIQFVNETQNWAEWWTLWRRIAGGLNTQAQIHIFNDISKYIDPAGLKQAGVAKQTKLRSYDDMVRLCAVLERLEITQKTQLANWFLQRLEKPSESLQTWWALGRVASRVPFHGNSHDVIPPDIVANWLHVLLKIDWKKNPHIGFAATLMSRMSGDRNRDIDETTRLIVLDKLKTSKTPLSWIEMVESVKELSEKEEKQIFGETLPSGLKLIQTH